jgi:hypothetical protein
LDDDEVFYNGGTMRNTGMTILLLGFVAACSRAHPRAELAPTCTAANQATLDDLQRAMRDTARIAGLERLTADTATTAALARILADTARIADLRRLAVDSTWAAQHQPQVDALVAELARFESCTR